MEISYLGHAAFKIKGKTATVLIDPFDPEETGLKWQKQEADIVLITHNHPDHSYLKGVKGLESVSSLEEASLLREESRPFVVVGPGEYEVKGVNIYGFPAFHDDKQGKERGLITVYLIEMDGLSLVHLGDMGHLPDTKLVEELNVADILMVPVGGVVNLGAEKASEVIALLEPYIVIPMHFKVPNLKYIEFDTVDKFLAQMGKDKVKTVDKLKITSRTDLPEETQVVVITASS